MGAWSGSGTTLTWPDFAVLGVLVAAMLGLAFRLGRTEETTSDFFLGRRRIPWWAACLSFVATEISAMTIVGVPATAYSENWNYAQFFIGSAAARLVIAFLFIPAFYRFDCVTIYEFLKHRFGPETQWAASAFFFVTRLLASGVRLMAACVGVSVLLGWGMVPAISLFSVISIAYIAFGGIKAVVWTNVLQAITFVAAGLATCAFLLANIEGGIAAAWGLADAAGRLELWHLKPAPGSGWSSDPNLLWIAVLNGFFGSMSAFGTDHELMQRLLTVETRRESQRTMLSTILGSFAVIVIFMAVGTGLFVYYRQHGLSPPAEAKQIYPHFAVHAMPAVLRGLVLSAIFMASIDSPLASLSASFVTDIYKPVFRPSAPEKHYVLVSRLSVAAFGLALAAIAYAFSFSDKILWLAFKINGVTAGSLLGVFLLGLLTARRANRANVLAMVAMALLNLLLLVWSERPLLALDAARLAEFQARGSWLLPLAAKLPLGWTWLLILGTAGTFGLGWLLGPVLDKARPDGGARPGRAGGAGDGRAGA